MSLSTTRVAATPAATEHLRAFVSAAQAGDPLRAVTVIVPSNPAGVHLRRALAARSGLAAVRFMVLGRLAETLGTAPLAARNRLPLSAAAHAALLRAALRRRGGRLGAARMHADLVLPLIALDTELHRTRTDADAMSGIRGDAGSLSRAALEVLDEARSSMHALHMYDWYDLALAAADAVRDGTARFEELGDVCVVFPPSIDRPSAQLITALAAHTEVNVMVPAGAETPGFELLGVDAGAAAQPPFHLPPARVVIAPDPLTEVRAAVRACLAAMEAVPPVPLHRQVILYGNSDVYGALLRDTLKELRLPYSSLEGQLLAESGPALALLAVLRLRESGFARPAVLSWLAAMPGAGEVTRNQSRWDQLSRAAGIVTGISQWDTRLRRLTEKLGAELETLCRTQPDDAAKRAALQRDIADAHRIRAHVLELELLTTPPASRTWEAHVSWLLRICDEVVAADSGWTQAQREALELLREVLTSLRSASAVEADVDTDIVLRTLQDALAARRLPEGRMGRGLLIGSHRHVAAIDAERVHVLGAVDGDLPAPMPADPLLPDDPLDRRSCHDRQERWHWEVARASACSEFVVSAPVVDADGRAAYPAPWLLDLLSADGVHPSAGEVRSRRFVHARLEWVGSEATPALDGTRLSVHERRDADAQRARAQHVELSSIGVARRVDLPLGRALLASRSRLSSELTEFDGNLASVAASSPQLREGLTGRAWSATTIEDWAACPFRFMLKRVLGVEETDSVDGDQSWRMSAMDRGSLVHEILAEFFAEVANNDDPSPGGVYEPRHFERLIETANSHFASVERRGITGHPVVWAADRALILNDLREVLVRDASARAAGGWRPRWLEQPFGMDGGAGWPAATCTLHDGRTVSLHGIIDRVDTAPARARVVDYKTGRFSPTPVSSENLFNGGTQLQLAVYARAVRQHLAQAGGAPPTVAALYWFISARAKFATLELQSPESSDAALAAVLAIVDEGLRAGSFPQVPGAFDNYWARFDNCRRCAYDDVCPAGRDIAARRKRESAGSIPHVRLAQAAATEEAE